MNFGSMVMSTSELSLIVIFAVLILWVLIEAIRCVRRGQRGKFVESAPTLMTSLGILGTFIGIVVGLFAFDPSHIDESIKDLLSGLRTAFVTSVFGMGSTIFFKWWDSRRKVPMESGAVPDEVGPKEIYGVLRTQSDAMGNLLQAVGGSEEHSLVGQLKLLRTDFNDFRSGHQRTQQAFEGKLWNQLKDFADMMSKSATEQVIEALRQVIVDFNNNLTEQFGDNFKRLDESVKKLVDWQAEYKQQMEKMIDLFDQGTQSIDATRGAVIEIKDQTGRIPADMQALGAVIDVNQHQIQELGRHLEAFMALRQQAVQAVPDIQKKLEEIGVQLREGAESMNKVILEGAAEFGDQVKDANRSIEHMAKDVQQKTEGISKELTDAMIKVEQNTDRIRTGVSDAIGNAMDAMQAHAEKSSTVAQENVERIMESVRRDVERGLGGVEKQMQEAVSRTGEAVNAQLRQVDEALERQLNQALSQLGSALATIARHLTDTYNKKVSDGVAASRFQ